VLRVPSFLNPGDCILKEIMTRKMSQSVELCNPDETNSAAYIRYCIVDCTAAADIIGGVPEFREMGVRHA